MSQLKVVYESRSLAKRKRKSGNVVRYRFHGLLHEQVFQRGRWRTRVRIGAKWFTILNTELPTTSDGTQYIAHPADGVCRRCGYIYSHLMHHANQPCDECRIDDQARRAEALKRALGVDLGWTSRDPISERIIHGFRAPIRFGMREAW